MLAARIPGMAQQDPVGPFFSRHLHFLGIDHDYMIAAIHMGRETRLVLTANDAGDFAGQTTQYLGLCVHNYPALLDCGLIDMSRLITIMVHAFLVYFPQECAPSVQKGTQR